MQSRGPLDGQIALPALTAFCFGVADGGFCTILYSFLGHHHHEAHSAEGFALLQLGQNLGSAAFFFFAQHVPFQPPNGSLTQVWVLVAGAIAGLGGYIMAERRHDERQGAVYQLLATRRQVEG